MRQQSDGSSRVIDLWTFRSTKSNKRYIVEIEYFENNFLGLKFYWKGVENSPERFSILTNDFEPRVIIYSCIQVMLEYYTKDKRVSFGFVGAPDLPENIKQSAPVVPGGRRFRFYRRLMNSWFGLSSFLHAYDRNNRLYLMVNLQRLTEGSLDMNEVERGLNKTFKGNFSLCW